MQKLSLTQRRQLRTVSLLAMAHFYMLAGVMHFINPEFYLKIMPPFIPHHELMVQLSGLAEILLGAWLLYPPVRRLAAWGVIALLAAVFPANIYQYLADGAGMDVPGWALLVRLPVQGLFFLWAWYHTQPELPAESPNAAPGPAAPDGSSES